MCILILDDTGYTDYHSVDEEYVTMVYGDDASGGVYPSPSLEMQIIFIGLNMVATFARFYYLGV